MALSRKNVSELYRPLGPKLITNIAATPNTVISVVQAVDLTLPIRGFRFVYKARIAVATANYTSVTPESVLNLISNIQVTGVNRRQGGNVTPIFGDLASLFGFAMMQKNQHGFVQIGNAISGNAGGVLATRPGIPYKIAAAPNGTLLFNGLFGTETPYDVIISVDIPLGPFIGSSSNHGFSAAFLMRQEEWKDSITMKFTFPAVTDNAANPLGTSAATTVTTFTAFGSGAGTPTLDIYSLPVIMGSTKDLVVPGVLNRSVLPVTTPMQTTANNVEILRMQKNASSRIYIKTGTSTTLPVFLTLSDVILTAFGAQVGSDRNVRDVLDWQAHRAEWVNHYHIPPIQGYNGMDFLQTDNPDASYPADALGDGAIFRIVGNVTGAANQVAHILQEQVLQMPQGALFGA